MKIKITNSISLENDEIEERFVTSRGSGGQNVNKVATGVQLRFNVSSSKSLPDYIKNRILNRNDTRLTKEGELIINADRYRTQEMNRRDARERLLEIILSATRTPKKRIKTKPTKSSKKKRLDKKTKHGLLKKSRSNKHLLD
jgi:ribosome-associated protein